MADWENIEPDEYKYLGCNYNPGRPQGIHGITIHHMAGDLDADDCNRVWRNAETSAHYSIDRNGWIVQHVDDGDRAWACGNAYANDTTISIEHANNNSNPWTVYDAAIESGAHLVAALCKAYGLGRPEWEVNVFPHQYWSSTACPGELAGSQRDAYMSRAQEWYDAMVNGTDAGDAVNTGNSANVSPSAPSQSHTPSTDLTTNVHYAFHVKGGDWLPEVTNFNNSDDNGYAGNPNEEHDMLLVYSDAGAVKYQVHTIESGWLDPVWGANYNDDMNGMAGNWGETIDAVNFWFETPSDWGEYSQGYARCQTTKVDYYLPTVCDFNDYAGNFGQPIDRLQLAIAQADPF